MHRPEGVAAWYDRRLDRFSDYRALGFNRRSSQILRFDALSELGDFEGRSVLDVGCGMGDFLEYLRGHGVSVDYFGIDVTPRLISGCKARFPAESPGNPSFAMGDVLDFEPHREFDFVLASGVFGLKAEGVKRAVAPALRRMFSWCRRGLAVNFLSSEATRHAPRSLYFEPASLLGLALDLTPSVRLNHDYLPNDVTLYLNKTPAWGAPRLGRRV